MKVDRHQIVQRNPSFRRVQAGINELACAVTKYATSCVSVCKLVELSRIILRLSNVCLVMCE